jgi:DNA-binding NarL/FixJ family response regulator
MPRRRIIIVDDHPLFRSALRQTLAAEPDIAVEEAGDLAGLNTALDADRDCDLVLLDLGMPGVRGFSGLLLLRTQYPDIPVMIISALEDAPTIRRAFELGALGYLRKSVGPAEIRAAIDAVLAGNVVTPAGVDLAATDEQSALMRRLASLTPQQVRVLMMLSDGLMNKQIAYELSISEATVKAHVSAILQKLDVDSRTQAVIAAAKIEEGHFDQLRASS